ncbi:MAG: LacI family transcriptional regulator [Lachnospiraceae bacterium]|nr:LacI family transcriptional regulator [Lachnospiraceae bacterium]
MNWYNNNKLIDFNYIFRTKVCRLGVIMKKPTLQEIANSLGVSRTTVWKVFSGQEGVSEDLRNRIIAKAQEMNYKIPEGILPSQTSASESPVNIALAVCRPETSVFWMDIIHQIAKELSRHNVNLVYTYLPSFISGNYILPASLTNGNTHGIIIMNVYNEQLLRLLAACPIPKVFFDTATAVSASDLNGDLILTENYASMSKITEHLIKKGRKSFGFIGDINYAKSNWERYDGFSRTLLQYGMPVHPELCLTSSIGIDTYKEEIEDFLGSLPYMPDAFVCANDYVGCILMQLLSKRGIRIPEDVALSGFDANMENPLAENLTTVQVFNQDIGFRLALQILYRIQHPDVPYEITYVATRIIFRSSTADFEA